MTGEDDTGGARENLPNLLVIGAQKSGTSWLHSRLGRHPDIFMSARKELGFFNARAAYLAAYSAHFAEGRGARYRGESTPGYFWSPLPPDVPPDREGPQVSDVPSRVRATLGPDVALIVILRHPVERAVSAFFHHYRKGRIGPEDTLAARGDRHGIFDLGHYRRHLEAWWEVFGEDGLLVLFHDELARRPQALLNRATAHLSLPPFQPADLGARVYGGGALALEDGALRLAGDPAGPRVTAADLALADEVLAEDVDFVNRTAGAGRIAWRVRTQPVDLAG